MYKIIDYGDCQFIFKNNMKNRNQKKEAVTPIYLTNTKIL